MEKYYWFVTFHRLPNGDSIYREGSLLDMHPFEYQNSCFKEGLRVILLNWKEITKEEYNAHKQVTQQ